MNRAGTPVAVLLAVGTLCASLDGRIVWRLFAQVFNPDHCGV